MSFKPYNTAVKIENIDRWMLACFQLEDFANRHSVQFTY